MIFVASDLVWLLKLAQKQLNEPRSGRIWRASLTRTPRESHTNGTT